MTETAPSLQNITAFLLGRMDSDRVSNEKSATLYITIRPAGRNTLCPACHNTTQQNSCNTDTIQVCVITTNNAPITGRSRDYLGDCVAFPNVAVYVTVYTQSVG